MSIKVLRYFLSLRNCCFTLFFGKTFLSYLSLPSNTFLLFSFQCTTDTLLLSTYGGDEESRTPDPLLARQVLSQLSYTPILWWA